MFRKLFIGIFILSFFIQGRMVGAEEGPVLKDGEQIDQDMDEEGLKRLGNFGKFHFFGYGELHSNNRIGPSENEIDFHRLVLGFGYDFTDKINFRAELDFEHAFKEPELEFAYVDFLLKKEINLRVGAILVPMGVLNQHHEPPLFYSVERPELYRVIIPTTWQGAGAGAYGKLGYGFEYEIYGLSSLTAVGVEDGELEDHFTGSQGFHDSFGIGESPGRDFGLATRLQYVGVPGLRIGTSAFLGNTGQGNANVDGGFLTMLEMDARYSFQGIDLEGAFAWTRLTDAGNINTEILSLDPLFTDFVGTEMMGWYLEAAYHVFHHVMPDTKHDLVAFVRYEDFDTQYKMPAGFAKDQTNNRNTVTLGLSYMPIPQVAIKADYMINWNKVNAGVDQLNFGIGFYY